MKSDLERYVLANYSRQEILDLASRDYPEYAWSLSTLSRRLNFFGVKYICYETSIEDVKKAVQEEMEGLLALSKHHRGIAGPRDY